MHTSSISVCEQKTHKFENKFAHRRMLQPVTT